MYIKLLLTVLLVLISLQNASADNIWPDLHTFGYVKNRPATLKDVGNGKAAFSLQNPQTKRSLGTPINMTIPQYVYHIEVGTGKRTPGILIQAEGAPDKTKLAGVYDINTSSFLVCTLDELVLLGTNNPKDM